MGDFICFKFDKYKTFQDKIVEQQYNNVFFLRGQKALVVKGGNISVQSSDRPVVGGSFGEVVIHGVFIGEMHNKPEMRPVKIRHTVCAKFNIFESQIKLPMFSQTTLTKAFSKFNLKFFRKGFYYFLFNLLNLKTR